MLQSPHSIRRITFRVACALMSCIVQFQGTAQDISKEELLGKFVPADHPDFVRLTPTEANRNELYLRKEVRDAFARMQEAAAKDGISLTILSATRNFEYQKGIWERKWDLPKYSGWSSERKARDILNYSSMPGSSRHHWGTDIDFNSVELRYWQSVTGKKVYAWLRTRAEEFGFCQTYTDKSAGRTGYEEEQWHWSYFPLSIHYLVEYNRQVRYDDLNGFSGAIEAERIRLIEDYVNGVGCGKN